MARMVRFRVLDGIAVVTLDAPPVNALSGGVRAGLWEVFTRIDTNPAIKAAVLIGAGPMFSAGADIREFGKPAQKPSLPQVCDHIENCSKPVVAATHGQALGGGTELLLAAHYRLAAPDARIGLPEVALGLVPGAGGTQRLPRLIGADRSLKMMISAASIDSVAAHRSGLIDGIVQGDIGSGAIAFAQNLLDRGQGPRRTRDNRNAFKDARAYQATIAQARASLKDNALIAPERVVDCVEVAALLPFEAGLAFEADAFARCVDHPQSIALRHIFLAERKADNALLERSGKVFKPVPPMGSAVTDRLQGAMQAAIDQMVDDGVSQGDIDGALLDYGFRRVPFGGTTPKSDPIIIRKIVAALVAEGCICVEQQAVQRPFDIDAIAVHGLRFPRRQGGPMRAAQTMGLIALRRDMRVWSDSNPVWAVPESLDAAIKDAKGFDALA